MPLYKGHTDDLVEVEEKFTKKISVDHKLLALLDVDALMQGARVHLNATEIIDRGGGIVVGGEKRDGGFGGAFKSPTYLAL